MQTFEHLQLEKEKLVTQCAIRGRKGFITYVAVPDDVDSTFADAGEVMTCSLLNHRQMHPTSCWVASDMIRQDI